MDWLPAERWVYDELLAGRAADFNSKCGIADPESTAGRVDRQIRTEFVQALFQSGPGDGHRDPLRKIAILGAWIVGPVQLAHLRFDGVLRIERCRVDDAFSMEAARLGDDVSFARSVFCKSLDLSRVRVDGELRLSGVKCAESLLVSDARIAGDLVIDAGARCKTVEMQRAKIAGILVGNGWICDGEAGLDLEGVEVGSDVFLTKTNLTGLSMVGARVGGQLKLTESRVKNTLDLEGTRIRDDLFLRELHCKCLDLTAIDVGGQIGMEGVRCTTSACLETAHVGQNLIADEASRFGKLDFRDARIDGELRMPGTKVGTECNMSGLVVSRSAYLTDMRVRKSIVLTRARVGALVLSHTRCRTLLLRFAKVAGLVNLYGSRVSGECDLEMIDVGEHLFIRGKARVHQLALVDASVRGTFQTGDSVFTGKCNCDGLDAGFVWIVPGSVFDGPLSMKGIRVGQDFSIEGARFARQADFSDARVDSTFALCAGEKGGPMWSDDSELFLRNATVGTLHLKGSAGAVKGAEVRDECWPAKVHLNGLSYTRIENEIHDGSVASLLRLLGANQSVTLQPYQQLAAALTRQARADDAKRVSIAGQERLRRKARGLRRVGFELLKWTIHYGIGAGYFRSLAWTALLTVSGALVFAPQVNQHWPGFGSALLFSFDQFLPIAHVAPGADDIAKTIVGWQQGYLAVHRALGFVLGSFVVAGISGITKKRE